MGHTSPDIRNYYIGKGNVYFRRDGADDFRHMGNVPEYEFTPSIENLEHFSSMAGIRTRDRTEVIELSGSLRILMEEFTMENLELALLGTTELNSEGQKAMSIFSRNAISGAVRFIGSNAVGSRFQLDFPKVDFIPGSSVNFISEEWGQMEVTGEVGKLTADSDFGTVTLIGTEGEEDASESESETA